MTTKLLFLQDMIKFINPYTIERELSTKDIRNVDKVQTSSEEFYYGKTTQRNEEWSYIKTVKLRPFKYTKKSPDTFYTDLFQVSKLSPVKGIKRTLETANLSLFMQEICKHFSLNINAMFGTCRKREYADVRSICQHIIYTYTYLTIVRIARFFNKDHTTIVHSLNKVEELYPRYNDFQQQYRMCLKIWLKINPTLDTRVRDRNEKMRYK